MRAALGASIAWGSEQRLPNYIKQTEAKRLIGKNYLEETTTAIAKPKALPSRENGSPLEITADSRRRGCAPFTRLCQVIYPPMDKT